MSNMADVKIEVLRKEIKEILKDADLTEMSSKKVRLQLEKKLNCALIDRKQEIDQIVMDYVNSPANKVKTNGGSAESESDDSEESDESDDDDDNDSEKEKSNKLKRKAPAVATSKNVAKKKSNSSGESSESASNESDEDVSNVVKRKKSKPAPPAKKAPATGKGKSRGFTRAYTLSPQLAAIMGAESCPRHEVVKKMWAIIKERNLYDPKNRQYAICDAELLKVIGVKRFRTFGMLKYLKDHFRD